MTRRTHTTAVLALALALSLTAGAGLAGPATAAPDDAATAAAKKKKKKKKKKPAAAATSVSIEPTPDFALVGFVKSSKAACVAGRRVTIFNGGAVSHTTEADENGRYATPARGAGETYAQVDPIKGCKAAKSPKVDAIFRAFAAKKKKKKLTATTVTLERVPIDSGILTATVDSAKTACVRGRDVKLLFSPEGTFPEREIDTRSSDRGGVAQVGPAGNGRFRVKVAATAGCKAATSTSLTVDGI